MTTTESTNSEFQPQWGKESDHNKFAERTIKLTQDWAVLVFNEESDQKNANKKPGVKAVSAYAKNYITAFPEDVAKGAAPFFSNEDKKENEHKPERVDNTRGMLSQAKPRLYALMVEELEAAAKKAAEKKAGETIELSSEKAKPNYNEHVKHEILALTLKLVKDELAALKMHQVCVTIIGFIEEGGINMYGIRVDGARRPATAADKAQKVTADQCARVTILSEDGMIVTEFFSMIVEK